jgi:hypothetical protein
MLDAKDTTLRLDEQAAGLYIPDITPSLSHWNAREPLSDKKSGSPRHGLQQRNIQPNERAEHWPQVQPANTVPSTL